MLRSFKDKWKTPEMMWDLVCFYGFFFWASCIDAFKGIPLSVIQLSWSSVCMPKGVGCFVDEPIGV